MKYEKGTWLIRRWKESQGWEVDLALFDKDSQEGTFIYERFFRFDKDVLIEIFRQQLPRKSSSVYDIGDRMEYNFREATKEELDHYFKIIVLSDMLPDTTY